MRMTLFFLIAALSALTACNKDFSAVDTTSATGVVATTCATGYVLTNGVCVASTTTTTTTNQTCQTGYGYNSLYGCLPQSTCGSGYGYYNGQCLVVVVVVTSPPNLCQDYCPAGYTATDYGCFPVVAGCPACSGLGPDGYCYWASYYLDWLYGYY